MSNRETKEIKTPTDNHVVVIKTYLTGREYREIENVFLSQANITAGGADAKFNGSSIKVAEDKLIEQAVVSVDGKTDKILDAVLDMKSQDTAFVVKELNEMRYGSVEGKKKLA